MDKTAIKNFAVWARRKLIENITYKAGLIGITEDGIAEKLPQSTSDLHFFDIGTKNYAEVKGHAITQREQLVKEIRRKEEDLGNYKEAFENIVEEVAYTWFNRLIAIRFMEVNDYLPSGVRVLSSLQDGKNEPDIVTAPFDADIEYTAKEKETIINLKTENKLDELFRMLFVKQCNELHSILPVLFEETDDYTEMLLTLSFTDNDGVVYHLTHDIPEENFDIEKEGQVEIIGWMYQYYNSEKKEDVFARLKKNIKITKDNIPAATQLFTPDWIVRYMVENSLGRLWIEGHPNDELKSNWKYYLEEAEQEEVVQKQLDEIRKEHAMMRPEEIKCIDPCMGSGHILVYLFDVLMQIYESCGYIARDAAQSIVENNLYGLDIDDRAAQLAYFAVMMKARQYDRKFFARGIQPKVYAICESNDVDTSIFNRLGEQKPIAEKLIKELYDAKEYGSILTPHITLEELDQLDKKLDEIDSMADYGNLLVQIEIENLIRELEPLINIARTLVRKYEIVTTNPPYMGGSGMNIKLSDFVNKNYPNSKNDISTVFMAKTLEICNNNGYVAMINIPVWMFLSSYERLRNELLHNNTIINMVHPGRGIFGSDFGTTSFVFKKQILNNYKGCYRRLFDVQGEVKNIDERETEFLSGKGNYIAKQIDYYKIPGTPIAYWVDNAMIQSFEVGTPLGKIAISRNGMKTGENTRFLRLWWEVNPVQCTFNSNSFEEAILSNKKWFPYNKGGEYRKWYGNDEYIVNWENGGKEIFENAKKDKRNVQDYPNDLKFSPSGSWGLISSGQPSFRYKEGNLSDIAGMSFYADKSTVLYLLGFCNSPISKILLEILAPTINYQAGDIGRLPILDNNRKDELIDIVANNIELCKFDWNLFETSWDFTVNPMVKWSNSLWDATGIGFTMMEYYGSCPKVGSPIELCYMLYKGECEQRFQQLKANEEELSRIFIDIYGLQDELTPEVEDKDVTVYRIFDDKSDIPESMGKSKYALTKADVVKDFVSYAVGCMLGRYSLNVEGLAYAGGEWDEFNYTTFIPDADNCIPITDEAYFEDDIVGRFEEFVRVVYGEDSLEDNLKFIASALGTKGTTSREAIRNYFLKDFIKDHNKKYQKRPVYWMFDSGKQNGFKALVYMHRWDADTVGNVRVEYLHKMQRVYDNELIRMNEIIDNSSDSKEVAKATKRKEKLQKQIKETEEFDAMIGHLPRTDIDLDDGVKVNYEKVQTAADGKKMQILTKI